VITRFAPSPTGLLHLGHAHSALVGWTRARRESGRFLLRIDDIDTTRCRREWEVAILEDLAWLGLDWETPVRRQSEHFDDYRAALTRLRAMDLLYPCFCTRQEIAAEIAGAAGAPHLAPHGPDGPLYPGTCRRLSDRERDARCASGIPYALRLDMGAATARAGELSWRDERTGAQRAQPELFGDVVLARKETPASYHLAVVVDDHLQGVSLVTRGEDLFAATHVHRLLQALLEIPPPVWHHHALIADEQGRRLAKRNDAQAIRTYRERGRSPEEIRALAGFG
jgi:glutamyl-Q tRNA(Asp) synthetase